MSTQTERPPAAWETELADSLRIKEISLAAEIPCGTILAECQQAARWAWHHCCASSNLCQAHHEDTLRRLALVYDPKRTYQCEACNRYPMPPARWREL